MDIIILKYIKEGVSIDKKRAIEIMDSLGVIDVECNGRPVWIENIEDDGTAKVKDLDKQNSLVVNISELKEVDANTKLL